MARWNAARARVVGGFVAQDRGPGGENRAVEGVEVVEVEIAEDVIDGVVTFVNIDYGVGVQVGLGGGGVDDFGEEAEIAGAGF